MQRSWGAPLACSIYRPGVLPASGSRHLLTLLTQAARVWHRAHMDVPNAYKCPVTVNKSCDVFIYSFFSSSLPPPLIPPLLFPPPCQDRLHFLAGDGSQDSLQVVELLQMKACLGPVYHRRYFHGRYTGVGGVGGSGVGGC